MLGCHKYTQGAIIPVNEDCSPPYYVRPANPLKAQSEQARMCIQTYIAQLARHVRLIREARVSEAISHDDDTVSSLVASYYSLPYYSSTES